MIPNRELNDMARSLMRTDEFTDMMRYRTRIKSNQRLNQQVMAYEREKERIMNSSLPPIEISTRLGRLLTENKALLEIDDIKNLIASTDRYQRMLSECILTLHKMMDAQMNRR